MHACMQALGLTFMQGQVLQSAERIRLPKLNDLMTIDYSYHILAVDRFATLDLKSNYSAISAVADGRRVRNECDAARLRGEMQNVAIAFHRQKNSLHWQK